MTSHTAKLTLSLLKEHITTHFTRLVPLAHLPEVGDTVEVFKDNDFPVKVMRRRWDYEGIPVLHLQGIWAETRGGGDGTNWATSGRRGDPTAALLASGWEQASPA